MWEERVHFDFKMHVRSQELENTNTGKERPVFTKMLRQDTVQCETEPGIRVGVKRPHLCQTKGSLN